MSHILFVILLVNAWLTQTLRVIMYLVCLGQIRFTPAVLV